ncbi:hypothetical protein F8M41_015191 [Gigaspora margarita]|uniref:Uncharacterized protein n=1 Tax=Gigaspora margarita TaxID=4874 RepID=A0A8H3ZZH5_GIGMA|nr:hypothetical protein F8M41_015191 [Gigaspora margarita]
MARTKRPIVKDIGEIEETTQVQSKYWRRFGDLNIKIQRIKKKYYLIRKMWKRDHGSRNRGRENRGRENYGIGNLGRETSYRASQCSEEHKTSIEPTSNIEYNDLYLDYEREIESDIGKEKVY